MTLGFPHQPLRDSANPSASLAGDVNYPPAASSHPLPDYAEMRPYNIGSRTLLPHRDMIDPQDLEPDRSVTRKLVHNGFVDVAWHLFEKTKDQALLAPTGTDDRIDQAWVSGPLAPAVSGYRRLDQPSGASDHDGLVFQLDTDAIDTARPWAYR